MASITSSGRNYRNSKKVDEVREVCQNRPEAEVVKVLEVFDNDVAKTIDAFMTDGGKEALSKWASQKRQSQDTSAKPKRQQNGNNNNSNKKKPTTDSSKANPDTAANNNKNNKNNSNINDLVSSIINQSINTTVPSSDDSTKTSARVNSGGSLSFQLQQQQNILNSLNNLILSGQSKGTAKATPLKVTVVEKESHNSNAKLQPTATLVSSLTSSPSSMSTTSVSSSTTASHFALKQQPPNDDNHQFLSQNQNSNSPNNNNTKNINSNGVSAMPFHALNNQLNMSYNNPNNTRASLDKSHKDLQRQSSHLAKIASQFQDDLNKAQINCNQSFLLLRNLLDQRQQQLQFQLNSVSRQGNQLLAERQHKASQLRILLENAVHLNDVDTLELKADIKHFVNERQVDEEFLKVKLFQQDNQDLLYNAIANYASIGQLDTIKYAAQRPPIQQLLNNNNTPVSVQSNGHVVKSPPAQSQNKPAQPVKQAPASNGVRHSIKITEVNGFSDDDNNRGSDNESGFIEVKKPQRNKTKLTSNDQKPNTNGGEAVNGVSKFVNGTSTSANTKSTGAAKKKKQSKKKENTLATVPLSKANINPFSLIANGHIN